MMSKDDKSKAMIAIVLCKLVLMHPMSSNLWQKLTESFIELDLADLASNAFSFVKELAKFSPSSTNEIYVGIRLNVNSWVYNNRLMFIVVYFGFDPIGTLIDFFFFLSLFY